MKGRHLAAVGRAVRQHQWDDEHCTCRGHRWLRQVSGNVDPTLVTRTQSIAMFRTHLAFVRSRSLRRAWYAKRR